MDKFNLSIITPEKKLYDGQIQEVFVPGQEGGMSILSRHAPLLAALNKGKIIVKDNNSTKEFEIESGFIELHKNSATILAR
ncbi:MAG: ATP synthase F1 subunit epsilon [Candidatus Omnitrophica bacterium]|nr:ATP synthase F1 subunit epsilon [Candidatus Omnitrophota bacterium]